jgi:hypothetical protein
MLANQRSRAINQGVKPFLLGLVIIFAASASGGGPGEPLVFTGMCDASTAVAISEDLFAAADDEDDVLRIYRLSRPGPPVQSVNLGPMIGAGKKRYKSSESDLEGATRLGSRTFWITSHGCNAKGKFAPDRHKLFALEIKELGGRCEVKLSGRVYTHLVADLVREPRLTRFGLAEASGKMPKSPGGLNIEALAATPEGHLLIGFRNPVPQGRALIVPLLNPVEVIEGRPPVFGDPLLLDLGGLGVREIASTGAGYLVIAGAVDAEAESRLFFWKGSSTRPEPALQRLPPGINPEGICFQDVAGTNDFLLLSDDGARQVNGVECKRLLESGRQFRAFRILRSF